jgi:catechol 2,3-dioxygenase-like lactoylglutathione lyase family enzyme
MWVGTINLSKNGEEFMLDHIILTVSNLAQAVTFYEAVLPHVNIAGRVDYDGKDGPAGHPDLKGFGANGRLFFWLREGTPHADAVHVGFVADSEKAVQAAFSAALAGGATSKIAPGPLLYYDPRYYAAQVVDLDGYTIEFVYKSWQH